MNVTTVDEFIGNSLSGDDSIEPIAFTSDDVLAAYSKGKNYISDEVRTVLSRTIPLAVKRGPQVVGQIEAQSGLTIPIIFMKVNGLSGYDLLCLVNGEDYLSSAKMRKAYVVASQIEEELFDNSFQFHFRFVMQSDTLNEQNILSEGYRHLPK
jgi:hypothetical protein